MWSKGLGEGHQRTFPTQTTGSCNNNPLCGAWWRLIHSWAKRSSTEFMLQRDHTEPKWHLLIRKPLHFFWSNPSCPKRALNLEKLEAEEGYRGIRKNRSLYFSSSWTGHLHNPVKDCWSLNWIWDRSFNWSRWNQMLLLCEHKEKPVEPAWYSIKGK